MIENNKIKFSARIRAGGEPASLPQGCVMATVRAIRATPAKLHDVETRGPWAREMKNRAHNARTYYAELRAAGISP